VTTSTTDTDTDVRFSLTIWLPTRAHLDSDHATLADARRHLAAEADRLGLAAELAALLPDEVTHTRSGLTVGGGHAHPRDPASPIRWEIKRSTVAADTVHILTLALPGVVPVLTVHRTEDGARDCLEQAVRDDGSDHLRALYIAAVRLEVTRADGSRIGGAANLSYAITPTELVE
jgi:hypothetical protein